jgi:hypothetical protein
LNELQEIAFRNGFRPLIRWTNVDDVVAHVTVKKGLLGVGLEDRAAMFGGDSKQEACFSRLKDRSIEICFDEAFAGDLLIPSYNETDFAFDEFVIVFLVLSSSEGTKYLRAGSGRHNLEDFALLEADVFSC